MATPLPPHLPPYLRPLSPLYLLLSLSALLPLLYVSSWVFLATIFLLESPVHLGVSYMLFFLINSHALIMPACAIISYRLYRKQRTLGIVIALLPNVLGIFFWLLFIFA